MGKSITCQSILSNLTNISFKKLTSNSFAIFYQNLFPNVRPFPNYLMLVKYILFYVLPVYFICDITFTTGFIYLDSTI